MLLFSVAFPGIFEVSIIFGILILLFGPSKVPSIARSFGQILPSFKKGLSDFKEETDGLKTEINNLEKDVKDTVKNI